jgi:large subunit ribosomal protein L6
MIKEIKRIVNIPEGINVEIDNRKLIAKKNGKELVKKLPYSKKINVTKEGNQITISSKKPTRRERGVAGTINAHIKNTLKGVDEGYVYKLEICNVHFPMNVKIEGKKVIIKNFLGEKKDRIVEILDNVEISMKGNIIELKSSDKEAAGQSAANIERVTKVKNRDRRVFQDGIYITEKEGKAI